MNFGAMAMTNALVAEKRAEIALNEGTEVVMHEANPAVAAEHNLETTKEAQKFFKMFIGHLWKWAIIACMYLWNRRNLRTDEEMTLLIMMIAIYVIFIGMDFFNDFGYWIILGR